MSGLFSTSVVPQTQAARGQSSLHSTVANPSHTERVIDADIYRQSLITPTVLEIRELLRNAEIDKIAAEHNATMAVNTLLAEPRGASGAPNPRALRAAVLRGVLEGFRESNKPEKKTDHEPGYEGVKGFLQKKGNGAWETLEAVALGDRPLTDYQGPRAHSTEATSLRWLQLYSSNLASRYDYRRLSSASQMIAPEPMAPFFAESRATVIKQAEPKPAEPRPADPEPIGLERLSYPSPNNVGEVSGPRDEDERVDPATLSGDHVKPDQNPIVETIHEEVDPTPSQETAQEPDEVTQAKSQQEVPRAITKISSISTLKRAVREVDDLVTLVPEEIRNTSTLLHAALSETASRLHLLGTRTRALKRWITDTKEGTHDDYVRQLGTQLCTALSPDGEPLLDPKGAQRLATSLANEFVRFGKKTGIALRLTNLARGVAQDDGSLGASVIDKLGEEVHGNTSSMALGLAELDEYMQDSGEDGALIALRDTAKAANDFVSGYGADLTREAFAHLRAARDRIAPILLDALGPVIKEPQTEIPESITDITHSRALEKAIAGMSLLAKIVGGDTRREASTIHRLSGEIATQLSSLNDNVIEFYRWRDGFIDEDPRFEVKDALQATILAIQKGDLAVDDVTETSTRLATALIRFGRSSGLAQHLSLVTRGHKTNDEQALVPRIEKLAETVRGKLGKVLEHQGELREPELDDSRQLAYQRLKDTLSAIVEYCMKRNNELLSGVTSGNEDALSALSNCITPLIEEALDRDSTLEEDVTGHSEGREAAETVNAIGSGSPAPIKQQASTPPRSRVRPSREEVYDLLMNARHADWVVLELEDNSSMSGAIIFNEFRGTGRIINVDEEISHDFDVEQVVDVRF